MLAISRALISRPEIFLLDEPSMGLAPLVVKNIYGALANLRTKIASMLLLEQNANIALEFADRAYMMETGRIVVHGKASDLKTDEKVKQSYLGSSQITLCEWWSRKEGRIANLIWWDFCAKISWVSRHRGTITWIGNMHAGD